MATFAFAILMLAPRVIPALPSALVALVLSAGAAFILNLERFGVQTIGQVPSGLPSLRLPSFDPQLLPGLVADAAGLALVSFTSLMLTARSFAAKNNYDVDADQEFIALGAANILSAVSQGFAISGADSRTAVADAAGGRTHATGLVAAAVVALVVVFFSRPLGYVPIPALGAVLVAAALSLVDLATIRLLLKLDWTEAALSFLATAGVVIVGAVNAILFVVALARLRFIHKISRPRIELLGTLAGMSGYHSIARHEGAHRKEGLLIFRFNGPLVFFNASYFKRELLAAVSGRGPELHWVILDLLPISDIDASGLMALGELIEALNARGVEIAAAGRATEWLDWGRARGFVKSKVRMFPTMRRAVKELSSDLGRTGPPA